MSWKLRHRAIGFATLGGIVLILAVIVMGLGALSFTDSWSCDVDPAGHSGSTSGYTVDCAAPFAQQVFDLSKQLMLMAIGIELIAIVLAVASLYPTPPIGGPTHASQSSGGSVTPAATHSPHPTAPAGTQAAPHPSPQS